MRKAVLRWPRLPILSVGGADRWGRWSRMDWLKWFGDHVGLAFAGATLWFLLVLAGYIAWVAWGGWETGSELALAQALVPIAFSGFGLVVACAAVLAFRPPRPELSCYVRASVPVDEVSENESMLWGPRWQRGLTFAIVNSGRLPAVDVVIEVAGGKVWLESSDWKETHRTHFAEPHPADPDRLDGFTVTVLERWRSLPNNSEEVVFWGSPDNPFRSVRIMASNATTVAYDISPDDWADVSPE